MRFTNQGLTISYSRSNAKLQETDKVRWFIFNMPAVKTCPYSTAMCRKSCYALKSERIHPNVRDARAMNLKSYNLNSDLFFHNIILAISKEYRLALRAGKRLIVRWHESGDFFSQEYFDRWLDTMRIVSRLFVDVKITAYTKSVKYVYNSKFDSNINILFSLWDDTPTKEWTTAQELGLPFYTACSAEAYDNIHTIHQCPCTNCAKCLKCYDKVPAMLYCKIH